MADLPNQPSLLSDVAMWHRRSGLPDNVTDDGDIIDSDAGRRLQVEKQALRAAIGDLSRPAVPGQARGLARLAASYLIAGDVETARRYVIRAQELSGGEPV